MPRIPMIGRRHILKERPLNRRTYPVNWQHSLCWLHGITRAYFIGIRYLRFLLTHSTIPAPSIPCQPAGCRALPPAGTGLGPLRN